MTITKRYVIAGQAHKQSLSSCVVDAEEDVERHFSLESLRDLFKYNENTLCDTHDTFKCKRCKDGKQIVRPPEGTINTGATAADTSTWSHFSQKELHKVYDSILKEDAIGTGAVTFLFQNKVTFFSFVETGTESYGLLHEKVSRPTNRQDQTVRVDLH